MKQCGEVQVDLEDFEMSKNAGIYAGGAGMVRVGLSGKDGSGGGSECHVTILPLAPSQLFHASL